MKIRLILYNCFVINYSEAQQPKGSDVRYSYSISTLEEFHYSEKIAQYIIHISLTAIPVKAVPRLTPFLVKKMLLSTIL